MIGAQAMPGQAMRVVRLMGIKACALKKT
jgi:hypothetical protein